MADDSMAKLKMSYAINFFTSKLAKVGRISNKDKLTCVEDIKKLFGEKLASNQIPFVIIDISKKQFMDKNISKSKLLIQERIEEYGIKVLGKTLSEIVDTPELATKTYAGSTVNAGAYADALIKSTYTRLITGQILPKSKFKIVANIDEPSFIHPTLGQITDGIVVKTGVSIRGTSIFLYYHTCKNNELRVMHLFHLFSQMSSNTNQKNGGFFIDYSSSLPAVEYVNTNQYLKLLNNGQGIYTNKTYAKQRELWNTDTNQFDFSNSKLGDEVLIRIDADVTTMMDNQEINLINNIGCFPGGEGYKMNFYKNIIKNKGKHNIISSLHLYIGNEYILNNPSELLFSSDNEATVQLTGFYISVKNND